MVPDQKWGGVPHPCTRNGRGRCGVPVDKDAGTITGEEKKKHSCNPHVYTEWHIWKERNRRVFEVKNLRHGQVFYLI
jgi:hypothetical protein